MSRIHPAEFVTSRPLPEVESAWLGIGAPRGPGPGFRIGICDGTGVVIAQGVLETWDQVVAFATRIARLGYDGRIVGTPEQMQGCEVLFVPRG